MGFICQMVIRMGFDDQFQNFDPNFLFMLNFYLCSIVHHFLDFELFCQTGSDHMTLSPIETPVLK